ncbi:MAG TPA: hypothetical protein VK646_00875 [Actinomycetota bacterium]|nr:hypothetical protein [Actinomycetota bacterium]
MNVGEPKRVFEVEPLAIPVPEQIPMPVPERVPVEPGREREPAVPS